MGLRLREPRVERNKTSGLKYAGKPQNRPCGPATFRAI